MTKDELLKKLFVEYDLQYDSKNPESRDNDIFVNPRFKYKIITRPGLNKIEKKANITITFDPINGACGADWAVLRATGFRQVGDLMHEYTTFGSANATTCKTGYYAEMAEKRARSRIILQLAGLYELGIMGKDEIATDDEELPKAQPAVEKKTLFTQ